MKVRAVCDTSKYPSPPCSEKVGDRTKFLEATSDRRRDVFNPARKEITKMLDENLVHSFWVRQRFLDACKKWEEEEHTGGYADDAVLAFLL